MSGFFIVSLQSAAFVVLSRKSRFQSSTRHQSELEFVKAKAVSALHWTAGDAATHRRLPAAIEIIRGFWSRVDRIQVSCLFKSSRIVIVPS